MKLWGCSNHASGMGVVCMRILVLFCFFLIAIRAAYAQTVSALSDSSSAHQESPSRPRLKAPIHIVPFREPGTLVAKPFFAIAGAHIDYFGGPVIANVHIVQVLYGSGAYLPNLANSVSPNVAGFFTDITQSPFFDMLGEYGTTGATAFDGSSGTNQAIGHGFFDGQFTINPSAANNGTVITDAQIQNELLSQVAAGNLPAPVIDAQGNNSTLYMIFFPPGKTITADNQSSCVKGGFCAYHSSTAGTFGSKRLFYGVFPDMQPPSLCSTGCGGGLTAFDSVTTVISHELSEAVTDADVGAASGFARPLAWTDQVNGEIGDICVGQRSLVAANGSTYSVQQEFSNLQNDCVAGPPRLVLSDALFPSIAPGTSFNLNMSVQSDLGTKIADYIDTVHFSSSDPAATLPADYAFNLADAGSHSFVATLNTTGTQTINVTDTRFPQYHGSITVPVAVPTAAFFQLMAPATDTQGGTSTVFVTALDASDLVATNYSGKVHFTSSDAAAILPPDSSLTGGHGVFSVTFNTTGFQDIKVADAANPAVSARNAVNVIAQGPNTSTITVTASLNPSTAFQPVTYTATVSGANPNPTGTVRFTQDTLFLATVAVDASGRAQGFSGPGGGSHAIFADYSGDATHDPSSSNVIVQVVSPAPTVMTLNASQSTATFGTPVTLNAILSSPNSNGFGAGGVVTFTDNGNILSVGSPFISTPSLSVGTHIIGGSFSGTADFEPATAAPITVVITPAPPADYAFTVNKNAVSLVAGQTATLSISTNSLNGFTGHVQFSCANLPALATCTFSPSSLFVSSSGNSLTSILTIATTGPSASLLAPGKKDKIFYTALWTLSPFACGVVLLVGAGRRSRARKLMAVCVVLALAFAISSCGGSSSPPPPPPKPPATPAGMTTVTVLATGTATSGAQPANPNQQVTIALTVVQ